MRTYTVGYFVGSLAKDSINRKLAKALVRLAPEGLELKEIGYADLPLYNHDYDADYPPVARDFKEKIAEVDALHRDVRHEEVERPRRVLRMPVRRQVAFVQVLMDGLGHRGVVHGGVRKVSRIARRRCPIGQLRDIKLGLSGFPSLWNSR